MSGSDHIATSRVWHRILNCGFKIPVVGGEDSISNLYRTALVGVNRTYAYLGARLDWQGWIEAIRKGRTFATNGPLLEFNIDGKEEGEEIHLPAQGKRVSVRARMISIVPVEKAEILNNGKVVEGGRPVNQAAFAIHSQVHAARPDVVSAAHAHSVYGKTWSALGRLLDSITQDVCAFHGDHALFNDYTGVVLDVEEGKRLAHALGECKAVILRNHGLLTVGQSVDEAAWWFITMERSCQVQLMAEAAGKPVLIDADQAAVTAGQVGQHIAGWFSFQPLYDRIVREQPDLLD